MVLGWPNIQYGFIEVGSKCVGQAMEFLNDNKLQQESHNDGMKYVHNMNEVSQSILQDKCQLSSTILNTILLLQHRKYCQKCKL